jgi:hypothetical protein
MDVSQLGVLIPIIAVGGFFAWRIALVVSNVYTAKLKAQGDAAVGSAGGSEPVLAAVEELRREVAELAERVDFTERLLAKARDGEAGKLGPGQRRTGQT